MAEAANFAASRLTAQMPGGEAAISLLLQACREAGITNPQHIAYQRAIGPRTTDDGGD